MYEMYVKCMKYQTTSVAASFESCGVKLPVPQICESGYEATKAAQVGRETSELFTLSYCADLKSSIQSLDP